jgi:hypothetical protein
MLFPATLNAASETLIGDCDVLNRFLATEIV